MLIERTVAETMAPRSKKKFVGLEPAEVNAAAYSSKYTTERPDVDDDDSDDDLWEDDDGNLLDHCVIEDDEDEHSEDEEHEDNV